MSLLLKWLTRLSLIWSVMSLLALYCCELKNVWQQCGGGSWEAGGSLRCLVKCDDLSWTSHIFIFHSLFLERDSLSWRLFNIGRLCEPNLGYCYDHTVNDRIWSLNCPFKATNFWDNCFVLESLHLYGEKFKTSHYATNFWEKSFTF